MESPSLLALRRTLAWASEQGMSVRGQLSEEQVVALDRIFSGKEPWSFEHYPALRAFAHAMPRLDLPDLPALIDLGDALTGLDELRSATVPAWPTHDTITDSTFSE